MIAGLSGVLVGALALGVSAYTAWLQRRQAEAAVWPHVVSYSSNVPNVRWELVNKGVGPALIRSVRIELGGKPIRRWSELLLAAGVKDPGGKYLHSTLRRRVLSPNEQLPAFSLKEVDAAIANHIHLELERLRLSLCYCSVFEECWSHVDGGEGERTERVKACAGAAGEEFED
jgi:hypothetical protein